MAACIRVHACVCIRVCTDRATTSARWRCGWCSTSRTATATTTASPQCRYAPFVRTHARAILARICIRVRPGPARPGPLHSRPVPHCPRGPPRPRSLRLTLLPVYVFPLHSLIHSFLFSSPFVCNLLRAPPRPAAARPPPRPCLPARAHSHTRSLPRPLARWQALNEISCFLGADLCRSFVALELCAFADDPTFKVRKVAAQSFGNIAAAAGPASTVARLLPVFEKLAKDLIWSVRKARRSRRVRVWRGGACRAVPEPPPPSFFSFFLFVSLLFLLLLLFIRPSCFAFGA